MVLMGALGVTATDTLIQHIISSSPVAFG
jgi:hypothetical protein